VGSCGSGVNAKQKLGLGLKQQKGTGVLDKPLDAIKFAETLTKKMIPSTKPVFDRCHKQETGVTNWCHKLVSQTGVTSKKFWTHPKKGTVMRLAKNPKTGKYENVYEEP